MIHWATGRLSGSHSELGMKSARGAGSFAMRAPVRVAVQVEQAVYGSFAFHGDGYALLAQSPGCRAAWINEFRTACCNLGERPSGVVDAPSLFALRLPSGPWIVVRISPQGRDDRGRPGALAFHGLFVSARDYRRAGADPFVFLPWLRDEWHAVPDLRAERLPLSPTPFAPCADPRAEAIASALRRKRRVALESSSPIDECARQVWQALPRRVRERLSLATWTFGNANRFDLLAAPRLTVVALDASYVDPDALPKPRQRWGETLAAARGFLTSLARH